MSCQLITSDQRTFARLTCSVISTDTSVVSVVKMTVNRNFLCSCYLGCHATFLIMTILCVTVLVTVGKKSDTLSKFNANFSFMASMFLSFLNPHNCLKLQIFLNIVYSEKVKK